MEAWTVYFILILDNMKNALVPFAGIAGFSMFSGLFFLDNQDLKILAKGKRLIRIGFYFLLICILLYAFLPTTKQAAVIYILPAALKNEKLSSITGNSLELLDGYLRKWLDEMKVQGSKI